MALSISLTKGELAVLDTDAVAVWVTEGELAKQKHLAQIVAAFGDSLVELATLRGFRGKANSVLDVPTLGKLPTRRLVLVGVGAKKNLSSGVALRKYAAVASRVAQNGRAKTLSLVAPGKLTAEGARALAEGCTLGCYRFTKYLTGDRVPKSALSEVALVKTEGRPTAAERRAIDTGAEVAAGVCLARDLVNEPANELTPEAMAQHARAVAKAGKLKIKVLDKAALKKAGMMLHYAVGQGSANEPRFIHMTYVPKRAKKKLVFVGKGITFDSGGLCIKPAGGMEEMKTDMSGAGAIIGLMAAVAAVKPNVEVHGLVAAAENMPDAEAYRPGDVFKSLDGKTVEIINTDAEGRLVLADALAYARGLEPDAIIENSTLTGACMVALGKTCAGFMTHDAGLAKAVNTAATEAGETFWQLPLLSDLRDGLKSSIADLKHTGERWGGAITAGLFLTEFVGDVPYVHCDIAGPSHASKPRGIYPQGGTGVPVLTFLRMIENVR
jgi:leucyl aminopeptidase